MTERKDIEKELKFASGLTRSMASGIQRYTIRLGTRWLAHNFTIDGHSSICDHIIHCKLIGAPLTVLTLCGYEYMSQALGGLRKYYPEVNYESDITIIKYHVLVPLKDEVRATLPKS